MTPIFVFLVSLVLLASSHCFVVVSGQAASAIGAVYTASNELAGNAVLVSSISSTGALTYMASVPTGALGSDNIHVSDALFSSHAVVVDRQRYFLFVVNAGSDSLSLFTIDPAFPTSIALVGTEPSGFDYPVAIALNPARALACVTHGGVVNGIRCFDYSSGVLAVIPSWDRPLNLGGVTNPPTPVNGSSDIQFTPDGQSLLIAAHDNGLGLIYFFPIDYSTNSIAATATIVHPRGARDSFSLQFFGTDSVLVTDPGAAGASLFHYDSSSGNSTDATLIPVFNVTGPGGPNVGAICWSAYSARTGSWYLIGATGNGTAVAPNTTIAEITVNPTSLEAALVALHPAVPFVDSQDATVVSLDSTTDVLLVLGPIGHVIAAYNLPAPGVLVPYQEMALTSLAAGGRSVQGLDFVLAAVGSSVKGDPAFVGFRGQRFQVHGIPMRHFNLLSTAALQVNAKFVLLEQGQALTDGEMAGARLMMQLKAGHRLPHTTAFSHTGTFLGEVGIKLGQYRLHAVAGSYLSGIASLTLDGHELAVSEQPIMLDADTRLTYADSHTLHVRTSMVSFTLVNSDHFFNLEQAMLTSSQPTSTLTLGGLLGQTANPAWIAQYESSEFREHQLMDFLLASEDIFSDEFAGNLFQVDGMSQ